MSAAARLRRRDESATIIVLERGPYVSYANCGLPYYVSGEIASPDDLLLQTPQSLAASLNLDVRVGHTVTGLDPDRRVVLVASGDHITELAYDAVILAPGAVAARPPIPGLDHPSVRTLKTVDDARALRQLVDDGARRAVVLGAGFIGLEAAEALVARGLDVAVVEYAPHVLPPLETELAWLAAEELRRLGVSVHESAAATTIDADPVVVRLADGTGLPADIVVLATGVRPDTAPFEAAGVACDGGHILIDAHGRTNLPEVYAVGDATMSVDAVTRNRRPVPLAGPANRGGRYVADAVVTDRANRGSFGVTAVDGASPSSGVDSAGRGNRSPLVAGHGVSTLESSVVDDGGTGWSTARPMPRALGTAILRLGQLTVAMTGANRAQLERAELAYTTVHLHAPNHAGYFPGAHPIHLVVHFDPVTGQLLGAQAVGVDGVDKRIDIIATAMRSGLTAPDLIDLDLSYSPPYGAAKDPITMVGLATDNVLTAQLRLWQPDQLEWARSEDVLLLDVRTAREFATGHLPEAVNVPHTQLRDRLDEVARLAKGRPIAVMCQSGMRSYIAHRILTGHGFDSSSLSGGMLTLRAWLGSRGSEILV
jgi:NADPH-dependent 2,4-dienoyl-CoA reductase/sulfur reductase-like enzyme/rhodanese-related sulfurtransferase